MQNRNLLGGISSPGPPCDLSVCVYYDLGVSALMEDPDAPCASSEEAIQKLGHVLQLARLQKHMLAVSSEYNDTHMDALLALHNVRVNTEPHLPQTAETEWKIDMDGSVAPPTKNKKPPPFGGESATDEEAGDGKMPKMVVRPGMLEPPRWPLLDLLPTYHQRLLDSKVTVGGILHVAESVATIPYAAPLVEKLERISSAICAELALPSLATQCVGETQLLSTMWLANRELRLILSSGPRVGKAHGQMGAVLEEVRPGIVTINLWRVPLAAEFFSNTCLDRAAIAAYATATRALYDSICLFKAKALCAGEPAAAVSEQFRRDITRLRDKILNNIPSAIVPPQPVAQFLVRVRANCVAQHLLVLRNSRNTLLQDDNQRAATLVRHMYHYCTENLLCEKAMHLEGCRSTGSTSSAAGGATFRAGPTRAADSALCCSTCTWRSARQSSATTSRSKNPSPTASAATAYTPNAT